MKILEQLASQEKDEVILQTARREKAKADAEWMKQVITCQSTQFLYICAMVYATLIPYMSLLQGCTHLGNKGHIIVPFVLQLILFHRCRL